MVIDMMKRILEDWELSRCWECKYEVGDRCTNKESDCYGFDDIIPDCACEEFERDNNKKDPFWSM